jgi:hypothetical protein
VSSSWKVLAKTMRSSKQWLDQIRARKGGKLKIGLGGSGVRVTFTNSADMVV